MIRTVSTFSSSLLAAALFTLTGASAMAATQTTKASALGHHNRANTSKIALVAKADPSAPAPAQPAAGEVEAAKVKALASKVDQKGERGGHKVAHQATHQAMKTAARSKSESEVKSSGHIKEKSAVAGEQAAAIPAPAAPSEPSAEKGAPKASDKTSAPASKP